MRLKNSEIDALQNGTFSLQPLRCVLKRDADDAPAIEGAGALTQTDEGFLQLSVLCGPEGLGSFQHRGEARELLPPDAYFSVTMVDTESRIWHAKKVLLNYSDRLGGRTQTTTVTAPIWNLQTEEKLPHEMKDTLELVILDGLGLHGNARSISKTEHDGNVTIRRSRDRALVEKAGVFLDIGLSRTRTRVLATSDQALSAEVEYHILNALQVPSARFLQSGVVVATAGRTRVTSIRSAGLNQKRFGRSSLKPIEPNVARSERQIWELFERALEFAFSDSTRSRTVMAHWNGTMRAQGGTVELQALVASVAVEGIARSGLPKNKARKRGEEVKALKRLARQGAIDESLINVWERTRNKVAHGGKVEEHEIAEFVHQLDAVTTLLHQLVFHAVGYSGPFADYAARPARNRDYPLGERSVTETNTAHTE